MLSGSVYIAPGCARLRHAAVRMLCQVFAGLSASALARAFSRLKDGYTSSKHARELSESEAIITYASEAKQQLLSQGHRVQAIIQRARETKRRLHKGGLSVLLREMRHGQLMDLAIAVKTMQTKMDAHRQMEMEKKGLITNHDANVSSGAI